MVDTGPLITLAVAQSLDYLLYVDADVIIPDAARGVLLRASRALFARHSGLSSIPAHEEGETGARRLDGDGAADGSRTPVRARE
ncbi:MAG: hypothetical protein HIU82_20075 [Proteobacteria bacterium]|nr:hypothetical protein [Pseudomonadota bacterium]